MLVSSAAPSSFPCFPRPRSVVLLAHVLAFGTRVVAWLFIPLVASAWWFGDPRQVLSNEMLALLGHQPPSGLQRILGFVAALGSTLSIYYGLRSLSAVCAAFCAGRTFDLVTLSHYHRLSLAALWFAVFMLLEPALLSLILTLHAAPGQHTVIVNFGSANLYAIFAALALRLLRAIMSQAHALQEECNARL